MDSLESLDISSFIIFSDDPWSLIISFCQLFKLPLVVQCCNVICEWPLINESFLSWIRRYVCSVKFCIDRDWYWYACIKLPLLHCEEQIIFMHIEVKHQISSFDGSCHCHCILFSRLWKIVIIWGKINVRKKVKVFSDRTAAADIANNRVCTV